MFQKLFKAWENSSFYLDNKVYYAGIAASLLFVISFFFPLFFTIAFVLLVFTAISVVVDAILLYAKSGIVASRIVQERLSNGDDNKVVLPLENHYDFPVKLEVIDELPFQFQEKNWKRELKLNKGEKKDLEYILHPHERGVYQFGNINVYVEGPLKLVKRRYIFPAELSVKVYPSYVQMRRYQLLGAKHHIQEAGVKKVRKLGHSMEFEQIKDYVRGDDYRTINWKATARRGDLMVNNYTDERSQQIYCIINKGRSMKMPFEGMTLLDYAINASLVLSNVALQKQDRAGLIAFSQKLDAFIPADKKPTQINHILETLYKQQTAFLEPDLETLFSTVRNRITQRSLLLFFTNYETFESLQRELPTLKRLAHYHLLVVIFFENTELRELTETRAHTLEDVYIKTIAEKYRYEKDLIVKELNQAGIIAVLTTPQKLTVNALNKYLELKDKQSI